MNRFATAIATLVLGLALPAFAQNQPKTAPPAPEKQRVLAPQKAVKAKSATATASSHDKDEKTMKKGPAGKATKKHAGKGHPRHAGKSSNGKHQSTANTASKSVKSNDMSGPERTMTKKHGAPGSKPMRSTVNRQ